MHAMLFAVVLWFMVFRYAGAVANAGLRVRRLAGMNMDLNVVGEPVTPGTKSADSLTYSGNQIFLQIGSSSSEESIDGNNTESGNSSVSHLLSDTDDGMFMSDAENLDTNASSISALEDVADSVNLDSNASSISADEDAVDSVNVETKANSSSADRDASSSMEDASISKGSRVSLLRSELVDTTTAAAAKKKYVTSFGGKKSNGLNKASVFQEDLKAAGDQDDRELMVCLGSIVVLLCMFACITRLAPLTRCAMARQAIARETLQQSASDAEMKKGNLMPDEAEMTTTLKSASTSSVGCEEEIPHRENANILEDHLSSLDATTPTPENKTLREQVSCISSDAIMEVLEKLQAVGAHAGGFDFAIARPLSSHQVLRIQAKIVSSSRGSMLTPLTLQPCVLYQATVCRRLHAGVPSVPVAFASMSAPFQVELCDHTDVHVAVDGEDVMLFDMCDGQFSHTGLFAEAPELLQDFVLTHRSAVPGGQWQTSSSLRSEVACLEFQQCGLLTESTVTLVGELVRDAGGSLALRPTDMHQKSCTPRVLVSDDPTLL